MHKKNKKCYTGQVSDAPLALIWALSPAFIGITRISLAHNYSDKKKGAQILNFSRVRVLGIGMDVKNILKDKKFWFASFLITWAAALQVIPQLLIFSTFSGKKIISWKMFSIETNKVLYVILILGNVIRS